MILFNQYINEAEESLVDLILKNCQPFLKAIGNDPVKYALYRGMKSGHEKYVKKTVRKNRKSLSTLKKIHDILNDAFYKEFGIKARSECLFAVGDSITAEDYGTVHYIFPIGKFKFYWSPKVRDLFNEIADNKISSKVPESKVMAFAKKTVKTYQKTDLKKAIKSRHEIMIDCKKYYAVKKYRPEEEEDFLKQLARNI